MALVKGVKWVATLIRDMSLDKYEMPRGARTPDYGLLRQFDFLKKEQEFFKIFFCYINVG